MPKAKVYNVVSLFTGSMGLDLGLETTGRYRIRACLELNHQCCETIRLNQQEGRLPKDLVLWESDITTVDPLKFLKSAGLGVGEVDLLIGGPPCQAFSTAGRRASLQDARGTLLWQFLRFVDALRPKYFLMENVRGLLSAAVRHRPIAERPEKGGPPLEPEEEPGSVVRLLAQDLQKMSGGAYHADIFEVNSVNYGAPQIRERALFIGNRFNEVVEFPPPTHGHMETDDEPSLFPEENKALQPWRTLRDAIGHLDEQKPVVLDFSPRKKKYLSLVPPGSNWRSLPKELQLESMGKAFHAKGGRSGWWRRLTFDLPSPTLVTMPNHASTSLCHPTHTRALSIREYARIQEFPDDWKLTGTISEQYKQVGNAVPTRLGKVAGELIAHSLDALGNRNYQPYSAPSTAFRVVYLQSHVRTRHWFKNGQAVLWDDEGENTANRYNRPRTHRKVKAL
jgi:DNA (cytosine-5)-methyltransferase 1